MNRSLVKFHQDQIESWVPTALEDPWVGTKSQLLVVSPKPSTTLELIQDSCMVLCLGSMISAL